MTIDEGLPRRRHRVAWLENDVPPPAETAFVERGFTVSRCGGQNLRDPAYLNGVAAVAFTQAPSKLNVVSRALQDHGARLLNHDCHMLVRPVANGLPLVTDAVNRGQLPTAGLPLGEARKLSEWQSVGEGAVPLPHVHVFEDAVSWSEIANFVATHPAGFAPNMGLAIEGEPNLSEGRRLLLCRAFWNCAVVHLSKLDDGRSGVAVYKAHAELSTGLLSRWPLPYFVKVGNRRKIFAEYRNYEGQVDPYVPFHLGPHLVRERCCLGARDGIIVGDFVEESESLAECARQGRAAPAIACLFDRTLRGWHRDVRREQRTIAQSLRLPDENLLEERSRELLRERIAMAKRLGAGHSATLDLDGLRELLSRCTATPILVGAIHGDLHASNVRVRATDAIVIDFLASRRGPLVRDPASLEASLLLDALSEGPEGAAEWLAWISDLYESRAFESAPPHASPRDPWFRACVRQIRMHARHMEGRPGQYAAALAVALVWKATKDPDLEGSARSRRVAAYALAERLLSMPIVAGAVA